MSAIKKTKTKTFSREKISRKVTEKSADDETAGNDEVEMAKLVSGEAVPLPQGNHQFLFRQSKQTFSYFSASFDT